MKQEEIFGKGIWLKSPRVEECTTGAYILRSKFVLEKVKTGKIKSAKLSAVGLGFFQCYINDKRVGEDEFLPLSTDYETRQNYPCQEMLTHHRIYVPNYDVTSLLKEGENVLVIHFGGGWYTFCEGKFGEAKAIWHLCVEGEDGKEEFYSSIQDRIERSYTSCVYFTRHEHQDLLSDASPKALQADYDDSAWQCAVTAWPLVTEYLRTDCPADRLHDCLYPVCIKKADGGLRVYDTGKNCAALPFIKVMASAGAEITVLFSEEKTEDNDLDMNYQFGQKLTIIADGTERIVRPEFTWFGFRYFSITGDAEPVYVREVHSDVEVTSSFHSDNEILNWLYETFINTQLSNMHGGIPSDCPHAERRGYTGDGQLICHAAMSVLGSKEFYRKWIYDISDCQDVYSGHVQYTAPYLCSGGGPGGWGCAMIEVPYQFCKHYGEKEPLESLYGQMLRYFDYLETHSENGLVVSDKEGEWCLGDWCPPVAVILPAPFVNNYFYVKSLYRMMDIAGILSKEDDVPFFRERIEQKKAAIMAAYYNKWDGNFLGNMQGANAFAVDIGLGDNRTYQNLVSRYRDLGCYDTGIFGTDIVTRVLFEHGDGDVAAGLMMSEKTHSFGGMRALGATSLWEFWPQSLGERSHNHPMFGAVTAYLFDFILGIRQDADSLGYEKLVIAPFVPKGLAHADGYRMLPCGKVKVEWQQQGEMVEFMIEVPKEAVFRYQGVERLLVAGVNNFNIEQGN